MVCKQNLMENYLMNFNKWPVLEVDKAYQRWRTDHRWYHRAWQGIPWMDDEPPWCELWLMKGHTWWKYLTEWGRGREREREGERERDHSSKKQSNCEQNRKEHTTQNSTFCILRLRLTTVSGTMRIFRAIEHDISCNNTPEHHTWNSMAACLVA